MLAGTAGQGKWWGRMKTYLIVGQTNVGKTAFALTFAETLGLDKVEVTFAYPDGFSTKQSYSLAQARQELIGPAPHKTRCLQSMSLQIPQGKGRRVIKLVDSTGLMEGIHREAEIRRSLVQTLQEMQKTDYLLHVIDAAAIGKAPDDRAVFTELERQIAAFSQNRGTYLLIANKMDAESARAGLLRIKLHLPNHKVLPVSAQSKAGFREVRDVIARLP